MMRAFVNTLRARWEDYRAPRDLHIVTAILRLTDERRAARIRRTWRIQRQREAKR